jgi:hypothetical protein
MSKVSPTKFKIKICLNYPKREKTNGKKSQAIARFAHNLNFCCDLRKTIPVLAG